MTDDLVRELREEAECYSGKTQACLTKAADRIEQLEARLAHLIKTIDDAQQDLRLLDALRYDDVDNWA